jgi:cystathionine beta-synthase
VHACFPGRVAARWWTTSALFDATRRTPPEPGILTAIGNTPLVRLAESDQGHECAISVKLESANPGGSIKDRIARYILLEALRTHRIARGQTVVEFSSGNTGIGLAMATAALGLRALIVTSAKISSEKLALLRAYGAETVGAGADAAPDDPDHGLALARRLAAERGAFYFDQFHSALNPQAHYLSTGPEIWRQSAGRVDLLVAGMGTGGTISGTARFLKERNPDLQAVGVDAEGSVFADYICGRPLPRPGRWAIEGIGNDQICRALDRTVIDRVVTVGDEAAFETARRIAQTDGICVGGSSGAALWAARQLARECAPGTKIVVIAPDSGERYLSKTGAPSGTLRPLEQNLSIARP